MVDDMKIIKKAHEFALSAHGDQKRKFTDEPYYTHLEETAQLLWEATDGKADADMYVAAILHDVVEDTSVTLQEIGKNFGGFVMSLVDELTNEEDVEEEKQIYLSRKINKMSDKAFLIKLCDRLHNVSGLDNKKVPIKFVSSYVNETQHILNELERELTNIEAKLVNRIQMTLLYLKLNRNL